MRWWDEAKCQDVDLGWLEDRVTLEQMVFCADCPVRQVCLEEALKVPYEHDATVRAGTDRVEREKLRAAREGRRPYL